MSRPSLFTPCPAPSSSSLLPIPAGGRRLSALSTNGLADETLTSDLDYTRAIQQEFKNARPRRRATFARKQAAVSIFEDVDENQEMEFDPSKSLTGKTLLSKPAQRIPGQRLSTTYEKEEEVAQPLKSIGQAKRRTSIVAVKGTIPEEYVDIANGLRENPVGKGSLKKDPRRRTIFVPSDDTTLFTIHPGATQTNRLDDTFQLSNLNKTRLYHAPPMISEEGEESASQETMQKARRPRMSLAAAPRRVPLQQMTSNESNLSGMNVAGPNTGKENSPPGHRRATIHDAKPERKFMPPVKEKVPPQSRLFAPTAASQARRSVDTRKAVPLTVSQSNAASKRRSTIAPNAHVPAKIASIRDPRRSILGNAVEPRSKAFSKSATTDKYSPRESSAPKRPFPSISKVDEPGKKSRLLQYPVLSEDVQQPQLYEDSWLSQQEIALTEVANTIFDLGYQKLDTTHSAATSLRDRMLEIYHQRDVTNIHKRLQASLLYGALSRPKDGVAPPDPSHDIGLRKRFLGLWLDNYDESTLCAAAEVVVGRQITQKKRSMDSSEGLLGPSKTRRALTGFLETFFVCVEDVSNDELVGQDNDGQRWRKMTIRSLMMIWLLDQVKVCNAISGCLFKRTATRKSSASMLHGLAGLVIPSVGDVVRALKHSEYDITHVQDPLDEVKYHIDNIAIDLRDGIFLTRLVEILLFSPKAMAQNGNTDATVTIVLPDTTVLESALSQDDGSHYPRVLSQHIKMPCLGRAQKLHNVQVALSALDTFARSGDGVAADVTAEEIIDGHREKTLDLLWSLVSNFGLELVIDWKLLIADIHHNDAKASQPTVWKSLQDHRERLLLEWASAHGMKRGVDIENWTTSFADGKLYTVLLDDFASVLSKQTHQTKMDESRNGRLRLLGCSSAFMKQLASASDNCIPTKTTTVSNLAFLASRLLPLARRYYAATTIQRAYRQRRSKIDTSRRVALLRLAHACATVVQTQNRLVSAAMVLQRAWRGVLDTRISRLDADVCAFQVLARGWSTRRHVRRTSRAQNGEGVDQSSRVMGGW